MPLLVGPSLLVGVAAAGCSSGEGPGRLERLLSAMPLRSDEDPLSTVVLLGDVDSAERLSGWTRPDEATASDEQVRQWLRGLAGGLPETDQAVYLPFPIEAYWARPGEVARQLGVSAMDVHAYAYDLAGQLTVLQADSEGPALTEAMGAPEGGVWSVGPESETFSISLDSAVPSAGRVAVKDGLLACAGDEEEIQRFLGSGSTLADHAGRAKAVRRLDAIGAYWAAVLEPMPYSDDPFLRANLSASQAEIDERRLEPVPQQFDALAIGMSVDDEASVVTFVYHHASAAAAVENAPIIESVFRAGTSVNDARPFREWLPLQSVVVEGELVVATILLPAGDGLDLERFGVLQENIIMWR